MFECLPQELVEEIFHHLPLKTIGNCMSVCKSWNIMIKSHSFIFSHLSRPSLPLFLLSDLSLSDLWTVNYSLYSPKINSVILSFVPNSNKHVSFIGSSNGLVCLSNNYYNIILWNPVIGKHLQLPKPPKPPHDDSSMFTYGFGFDSKNNDFKVVRLYYPEGRFIYPPKVDLYSLNEGAWRDINASHIKLTVKEFPQHTFINGNAHWLATRRPALDPLPRRNDCILMFDMVEEKFNTMELPEQMNNSTMNAMPSRLLYDITVIDGCFSLIEYSFPLSNSNVINIWMRNHESWSKIHTFCLKERFQTLWGVSTRSEILVFPSKTNGLCSFDLKNHEIRDIGIKFKATYVCSSDFKASLVLLDKDSYDAHSDNESSARCKCWGPNNKLKDVQHVRGRGTLQRAWFYLTKKAMSLFHCEAKRMNHLEG